MKPEHVRDLDSHGVHVGSPTVIAFVIGDQKTKGLPCFGRIHTLPNKGFLGVRPGGKEVGDVKNKVAGTFM